MLIKSTGQSRISKMPHDPADSILFGGKLSLDHQHDSQILPKVDTTPKMGLDEYLRKFTSDDNASF